MEPINPQLKHRIETLIQKKVRREIKGRASSPTVQSVYPIVSEFMRDEILHHIDQNPVNLDNPPRVNINFHFSTHVSASDVADLEEHIARSDVILLEGQGVTKKDAVLLEAYWVIGYSNPQISAVSTTEQPLTFPEYMNPLLSTIANHSKRILFIERYTPSDFKKGLSVSRYVDVVEPVRDFMSNDLQSAVDSLRHTFYLISLSSLLRERNVLNNLRKINNLLLREFFGLYNKDEINCLLTFGKLHEDLYQKAEEVLSHLANIHVRKLQSPLVQDYYSYAIQSDVKKLFSQMTATEIDNTDHTSLEGFLTSAVGDSLNKHFRDRQEDYYKSLIEYLLDFADPFPGNYASTHDYIAVHGAIASQFDIRDVISLKKLVADMPGNSRSLRLAMEQFLETKPVQIPRTPEQVAEMLTAYK